MRARRGTEQEHEWRVIAYLFLGPASSSESIGDAELNSSQRTRVPDARAGWDKLFSQLWAATDISAVVAVPAKESRR